MHRPKRRRRRLFAVLLALLLLLAGGAAYGWRQMHPRPAIPSEEARCRIGAYRMNDGSTVIVRQRDGEDLRLIETDGSVAALAAEREGRYRIGDGGDFAAFRGCKTLDLHRGDSIRHGELVRFEEKSIDFGWDDTRLGGKIVQPVGAGPDTPYVVLVHGSERSSAIFGNEWQYLLPMAGIGVMVYDKRGTGLSEGRYTQDFHVLAKDAAAAVTALRCQVPAAKVGLMGASQGGWVAPLASTETPVDFVIALYGLAESALAEDRDEVMQGLRQAGFGEAELAKAREVTDATGKVMAADFQGGWDELAAVKAKYGKEPFFAAIDGEFSGDLAHRAPWQLRLVGPLLDVGTSWEYEPRPTLEKIDVDHLWVLAGDDHGAPSEATHRIIRELQQQKPNLDLAFFPKADHSMVLYERDAGGLVKSWRYAPGYRELVIEWIKTRRLAASTEDFVATPGSADAAP